MEARGKDIRNLRRTGMDRGTFSLSPFPLPPPNLPIGVPYTLNRATELSLHWWRGSAELSVVGFIRPSHLPLLPEAEQEHDTAFSLSGATNAYKIITASPSPLIAFANNLLPTFA